MRDWAAATSITQMMACWSCSKVAFKPSMRALKLHAQGQITSSAKSCRSSHLKCWCMRSATPRIWSRTQASLVGAKILHAPFSTWLTLITASVVINQQQNRTLMFLSGLRMDTTLTKITCTRYDKIGLCAQIIRTNVLLNVTIGEGGLCDTC